MSGLSPSGRLLVNDDDARGGPEPIPEDVMKAADPLPVDILRLCATACREANLPPTPQYMRPVARAIMAERERCAAIAAGPIPVRAIEAANWIAAAIRKGNGEYTGNTTTYPHPHGEALNGTL